MNESENESTTNKYPKTIVYIIYHRSLSLIHPLFNSHQTIFLPPPLLLLLPLPPLSAPLPPARRSPPALPRAAPRLSLTPFSSFLHTIVPRTRFFSSSTVIRTPLRSRRRLPSDPRDFAPFAPRGARCTRCSSITTRSTSRGSSFSNKLSSFYDETPPKRPPK